MKTAIKTHEGRVALVTGAAQGIGQAIALALAERGARVLATDLAPPLETVSKIGSTGYALALDVTEEAQWRSVAADAGNLGDVDIVVNNAGYFPNRAIDDLDLATWRKTMTTNLESHFLSVKYFLPGMRRKRWGRFIGISSNMVGLAIPGMSHYITTKMGIIGFMRGLANDVADDGITANAVLPGLINTQATAPASPTTRPFLQHPFHEVLHGNPRFLAHDAHHFGERAPFGFVAAPARQMLGFLKHLALSST